MMRSVVFVLAGVTGCVAVGDDTDTGIVEQADTLENGVSINGVSVNGVSVNGVSVNGVSVNGVSVNGVSVNGVSVNGGQLVGVDASGAPLSGADMVGAMFTALRTDGGTVSLRVDDAVIVSGDIWAYHVSQAVDGATWTPLCASATDGRAVVIAGRWDLRSGVAGAGGWIDDSTSFTFGCRQAAIAKCVELGYRPWATAGSVLLRNHHIACVRMIRADYCGDGTAWTQDGNLINVYDGVGVQSDTQSWTLDAIWSKDGATCSRRTRSLLGYPTCFDTMGDCSAVTFNTTRLIADEFSGTSTTSSTGGKVKTATTALK